MSTTPTTPKESTVSTTYTWVTAPPSPKEPWFDRFAPAYFIHMEAKWTYKILVAMLPAPTRAKIKIRHKAKKSARSH